MRFPAPACLLALALVSAAPAQYMPQSQLGGLKWRNIGPFRGGRVSAVTGSVKQPDTFYIGLPQGGVWKTTSAGQTWYPVFDSVKETSCVGSLQVAPADPNIVYAGTGEISGDGSGKGVYRSSDAGLTWSHIGLEKSRMIPSMMVDPHEPNLVMAAAIGAGDDEGVFRSTDGGKSWTKTLDPGKDVGIQHIAWAYDNPSVVIASSQTRFSTFGILANPKVPTGPMLYKSTDEGVTWTKLDPKGLPKMTGRICVAVAQNTQSQRMFLIGTFGLYRSDDGGANWRQMAADDPRIANGQGAYTSGVYVDTQNPDIVYTLATCMYRSLDGGKTFAGFKGAPGGDDPQQLWIDPVDRTHIVYGGDQGGSVSLDAGQTWGPWYNQATGQIYHISTDNQFPYWVYGTQQDSGCIGTASRGNLGAVTAQDWIAQPGSEGGYIVIDPLNPKISYCSGVYGGLTRVTFPSEQSVQIEPNLGPGNFFGEMAFSPSNPHELLMAGRYLVSSTDGGAHWTKLGGDLTFDPNAKPPKDHPQFEFRTITAFAASPLDSKLIWVGTSNGFVKVTRNHGQDWADVSIPGAKGSRIMNVEPSKTDPATAYVSTFGSAHDNFKPLLYRTHDFGKSWKEAANELAGGKPAQISLVRSDAKSSHLLFGLANDAVVSFDEGDHWQSLRLNLPTTGITDLRIHDNDLVISTFGRGIWILDDYSPLRELSASTATEPAHLFRPAEAVRLRRNENGDTPFPPEIPHAENPPLGAIIYYSLSAKPAGDIKLEVVDSHGTVIRHMSSAPIMPFDDPPPAIATYWPEVLKPMPTEIGLNRINWNVRYDTPPSFTHDPGDVMGAIPGDTPASIEGPLALPGVYTVRLIVDGKTYTQSVTVKDDPRSNVNAHDLQAIHEFRMHYYDGILEAWADYQQVATMRRMVGLIISANPPQDVASAAKAFDKKLLAVQGTLERHRRFDGPPSPTTFLGLNGYLLTQLDLFDYGDIAPTDAMETTYGGDWAKLKIVSDKWRELVSKDLVVFNAVLSKNGQPAVSAPTSLADPPPPAKRFLPEPVSKAR